MAVELTPEQLEFTTETIRGGDDFFEELGPPRHPDTEYELDQSESLTFLYNLLYDNQSLLSKSDILKILNSLKQREDTLPFSFSVGDDLQGVQWPPGLREKFYSERRRIGSNNWFHNIPGSFEYAKQLRNLVCSNLTSRGIYYPLSYYHDSLLMIDSANMPDNTNSFFKINRLMNDDHAPHRDMMKLDCIIDSRTLLRNTSSRISTLSCSENFLASGTFEGDYILTDITEPDNFKHLGEFNLTRNYDGITNCIIINDNKELVVSSNDKFIRYVDLLKNKKTEIKLPFAGNFMAQNSFNPNELFVSGDSLDSFIIDRRIPFKDVNSLVHYNGQEDYSFSCDWSPTNENFLLTGNQDGNVRIWDRRYNQEPLFCWNGALGSSIDQVNCSPVRNTKFSSKGEFVCWAESLDHIGIVNVKDLVTDQQNIERVQSIDFIGKCTGLSFCETESGYGEQLIVGVNDCPLGGILSYGLESSQKCLDFDFYF